MKGARTEDLRAIALLPEHTRLRRVRRRHEPELALEDLETPVPIFAPLDPHVPEVLHVVPLLLKLPLLLCRQVGAREEV